jgi:hypothetical protein
VLGAGFRVCAQERASRNDEPLNIVMPGLVPASTSLLVDARKTWMAGTSPAMTKGFFVNAMFTTFMRVRFTNVSDGIARNPASACVWRACIAD